MFQGETDAEVFTDSCSINAQKRLSWSNIGLNWMNTAGSTCLCQECDWGKHWQYSSLPLGGAGEAPSSFSSTAGSYQNSHPFTCVCLNCLHNLSVPFISCEPLCGLHNLLRQRARVCAVRTYQYIILPLCECASMPCKNVDAFSNTSTWNE